MSTQRENPADMRADMSDEEPENLPKSVWATLIMFAVFMAAAGGCIFTLVSR